MIRIKTYFFKWWWCYVTCPLVRQPGFCSVHFIYFVGRELHGQIWREWYPARRWRTTCRSAVTCPQGHTTHVPHRIGKSITQSVWVKRIANKTAHFVASWYRPPNHLLVSDNGNELLNSLEKFDNFREQLDKIKIKNINKGNNAPPPPVLVLVYFNCRDMVWLDRLNKSGSSLSQTEGQILIDIMNDHGLEQLVNFPTTERNTLDLILTSLPCQFVDTFMVHRIVTDSPRGPLWYCQFDVSPVNYSDSDSEVRVNISHLLETY